MVSLLASLLPATPAAGTAAPPRPGAEPGAAVDFGALLAITPDDAAPTPGQPAVAGRQPLAAPGIDLPVALGLDLTGLPGIDRPVADTPILADPAVVPAPPLADLPLAPASVSTRALLMAQLAPAAITPIATAPAAIGVPTSAPAPLDDSDATPLLADAPAAPRDTRPTPPLPLAPALQPVALPRTLVRSAERRNAPHQDDPSAAPDLDERAASKAAMVPPFPVLQPSAADASPASVIVTAPTGDPLATTMPPPQVEPVPTGATVAPSVPGERPAPPVDAQPTRPATPQRSVTPAPITTPPPPASTASLRLQAMTPPSEHGSSPTVSESPASAKLPHGDPLTPGNEDNDRSDASTTAQSPRQPLAEPATATASPRADEPAPAIDRPQGVVDRPIGRGRPGISPNRGEQPASKLSITPAARSATASQSTPDDIVALPGAIRSQATPPVTTSGMVPLAVDRPAPAAPTTIVITERVAPTVSTVALRAPTAISPAVAALVDAAPIMRGEEAQSAAVIAPGAPIDARPIVAATSAPSAPLPAVATPTAPAPADSTPAATRPAPPVTMVAARTTGSDSPSIRPDDAPAREATRAEPAFRAFAAALFDAARDPAATMAPTATAPATPTASAADPRPLDLTQPRWPQAMVDRIERLRDDANAGDTRIRLIPDALGTIDVAVRRDGDTVQVGFHAERAETRQLLAEARPELAALAEARGIKIADAAPTTGGGSQPPQYGGQSFSGNDRAPGRQPQPSTPAAPLRAAAAADEPGDDTRIA